VPLHILVQCINYPPEIVGGGKYTGEAVEWLAARGHKINVITAPPFYPEWKIGKGYSGWAYQKEYRCGVEIMRCPLWVTTNPSSIKRILAWLSFVISAAPIVFWKIIRQQPNIVFVVYPYLFAAPWVRLVSLLSKSKTWLHIQDFETDTAFELDFFKLRFVRRIVKFFENILFRSFNRVSTISLRMLERLELSGVLIEKTIFFPNWVDTKAIFPTTNNKEYRTQFNLSSKNFVALYSGNMGVKQGLGIIIETAKELQNKSNIIFLLCGDGVKKEELIQQANNLNNIKFIPLQPYEKLNQLLNMADVHLLPQRADVGDLVMPSKLSGMLASGRPILATANPRTQVADTVKNAGLVVPPGDVDAFVEAMLIMESSVEKRNEWGKRAREIAVQEWDKEQILLKFEKNLLDCI